MHFKEKMIRQFGQPQGFLGLVAGMMMKYRPSNRQRNRWTLNLLDLQDGQTILEIGFGPGYAMKRILAQYLQTTVYGLDHSEGMVTMATRENSPWVKQGRLCLHLGSVEQVSTLLPAFDRVFAVNCHQFWKDLPQAFMDIYEKLKPGGVCAITYQPRGTAPRNDQAWAEGQLLLSGMQEVGFIQTRQEILPLRPIVAVCVLGSRPLKE